MRAGCVSCVGWAPPVERDRSVRWGDMLQRMAKAIMFGTLDDRSAIYLSHRRVHRRWPDLRHQPRFSDRMAFRRLHPRPEFTLLADKIGVRDYVEVLVYAHRSKPVRGVKLSHS